MTSWIMQLWMKTHDESEWPDLSICQGDDATHVLDAAKHPSEKSIEKMCSEDFFAKHGYRYVERSVDGGYDNETYIYASCPPRSRLEETRTLVRNQECQEPNSSQSNEAQVASDEDASGYSLPFEENQMRTACYGDEGIAGCKKSHNEICEPGNSQKTSQYQTPAEIKGTKYNVQHANLECMYRPNSPKYDKPTGLPKDGTYFGKCQRMTCSSDQEADTTYDDVRSLDIYQNNSCKRDEGDCTIQANIRKDRECQHMSEFSRSEELQSLEKERDQASPFRRNEQCHKPNRRQSNEAQFVSDEDASGYSLPPEETSDKSDDTRLCTDIENQTRAACYRDEGIPGCKRRHNEICEAENSQNTSQHQTSTKIKGKKCNVHNANMDFEYPTNCSKFDTPTGLQKMCNSDQEGCAIFDKPAGIYQNIPCKMGQGDCTIQPNISKDRKCQPVSVFARSEELGSLEKGGDLASPFRRSKAIRRKKAQRFQSKKQAKWEQGNKENIYENTISRSQCVPQSEPVYANMQTEVETRHSSCEGSSKEDENLFHEDGVGDPSPNHGHGAGVKRHNSALQNFLTSVEVDFDDSSF